MSKINFIIALAFICIQSRAQVFDSKLGTSADESITALPLENNFVFDGKLDEEEWRTVQKISNFTQRELDLGEPITEKTEVAILIDDEYMYIGVWCYDREPEKIIAKEMRRDFSFDLEDNFIVILDTYH